MLVMYLSILPAELLRVLRCINSLQQFVVLCTGVALAGQAGGKSPAASTARPGVGLAPVHPGRGIILWLTAACHLHFWIVLPPAFPSLPALVVRYTCLHVCMPVVG